MRLLDAYQKQIEEALHYADDSHSFEDIKVSVERGELQFWPGVHSVIITEVVEVPRYTALNLFLAGGRMEELAAMLPEVEKFAQIVGADRITLNGRKGWTRSFVAERGYSEKSVVMEKKLNG